MYKIKLGVKRVGILMRKRDKSNICDPIRSVMGMFSIAIFSHGMRIIVCGWAVQAVKLLFITLQEYLSFVPITVVKQHTLLHCCTWPTHG